MTLPYSPGVVPLTMLVDTPLQPLPSNPLVSNLAGLPFKTGGTWTINASIANGGYANKTDSTRVDNPRAKDLARDVNNKIPNSLFVGLSNDADDVGRVASVAAECMSGGFATHALTIYLYYGYDRDNVTGAGARTLAQYQAKVEGVIAQLPPNLPVVWLVEPDLTIIGGTTVQNDIRAQQLIWINRRLEGNPWWTALIETGQTSWGKAPAAMADRMRVTEAWRASGMVVGMANFKPFPELHAWAKALSDRLLSNRPQGMPYLMESYGSEGSLLRGPAAAGVPATNPPFALTSLVTSTAGSKIVAAAPGTFQPWMASGRRPLTVTGWGTSFANSLIKSVGADGSTAVLAGQALNSVTAPGTVGWDRDDSRYNPAGVKCGIPQVWLPAGGFEGYDLCIGAMHCTNPCVSNDKWDGARQSHLDVPGPGGPMQRRIIGASAHVEGSQWFSSAVPA